MNRQTSAVRLLAGDKEPVRLASIGNLALAGLLMVDGVTTVAGDRVLVKNQTSAIENGIYTASEGAWQRTPDAAQSGLLVAGMKVHVQEGATLGGQIWGLATNRPNVGEDDINFELFLSAGMISDVTVAVTAAIQPTLDAMDDQIDDITATLLVRPDFGPVAAPHPTAIGDSLFTNLHASTALPSLIRTAMGWSSINTQAVGGATIADQAKLYGFQIAPSVVNPAMVWLGTNDVNLDADSRANEQTSLEGLRALLFHLAIPTAKRVTGQAMSVSAGSWSNMGAFDPGGTTSATNSAVKRGAVTGRHVIVAGWYNTSSNGSAIISIGNESNSITLFGDSFTFKRPAVLTNSPGGVPTTTIPFVRIYKNVGADDLSKMTVTVAVTSASGAGNDVFISYVAGLTGSQTEAMPLVMCFNLHNYTATAEAAQSTSGTRRQRFNRGIANIVDEMVGLGLWIVPVDAASVLWDTSRLGVDGLHPNDAGNTALTAAAVAALTNAPVYSKQHNSRLSASAYSDTLGSDLYARGRTVIEDFRRKVVPRTQVGSAFSAHNNGGNTAAGDSVDVLLGWATELYDINGDFASSTWSPPAGMVHISAAAGFTAGVDQKAYALKIYKNGAAFRIIGTAMGSGTASVQVSGSFYDLAADGDYYQVAVIQATGAGATVDGTATRTYFMGSSAY